MEAAGNATNASFKVLANALNSQINIHIPYGGVFPALAKREHIKNLPILLKQALKKAKLQKEKRPVDLVAVTCGPGLEPSLWTGIVFAKELAEKWDVLLIPVNHMEGHILSSFGLEDKNFKIPKIKFPMLSLLVSGGHTELVLSKKMLSYEIIGETADDAVGEAFDKVARMLGLPYPGGPEISKLAKQQRMREKPIFSGSLSPRARGALPLDPSVCETPRKNCFSFILPRPMLHSKNFNFSFSGLKTAVLYLIRKIGPLDEKTKMQIALEFENAAIECLTHKTKKAVEKYNIKTLAVAGGVAANKHLRTEMRKMVDYIKKQTGKNIELFFPAKELTSDNSIMIGIAGYLNFMKNKKKLTKTADIKAIGNLRL